jgi:hypothetical protein
MVQERERGMAAGIKNNYGYVAGKNGSRFFQTGGLFGDNKG